MKTMQLGIGRVLLVGVVWLFVSVAGESFAQPIERSKIPSELRDWIPWVLHDQPEYRCSYIGSEPICHWPGELTLELGQGGGTFEYAVSAQLAKNISLPGGAGAWPSKVRIRGSRAVVFEDGNGLPQVELRAGQWQITGQFQWSRMPDRLTIPADTALVKLLVEGKEIPNPRRGGSGEVWLGSGAPVENAEQMDRVDIDVYRRIDDGVPLMLTTLLRLRVSGKPRELDLGAVLLEGFTVREVNGNVPARMDAEGNLKVQVRPGEFQLFVVAHSEAAPEQLTAPTKNEPWPLVEIWSWNPDENLRQVNIEGAPGIDTARTQMPDGWRLLSAYQVKQEGSLTFKTTRRGIEEPPPDHLRLNRTMLLDFDGAGYTIEDSVTGRLSRTRRLDLVAGGVLGNVAVNGNHQLITAHPETGNQGVELRTADLDMKAQWRLKNAQGNLPAVGWSQDVQNLNLSLVLPPGWTLLGASGVDKVTGTWWESWNLWVFFVVLVIALAVGKLTRWYYGLVTLVMLVLCHDQPEGPLYIWLTLAVTLTLLQVVRTGKLAFFVRMCWWVFVFNFLVIVVPFAVGQIREGIFPQIQETPVTYHPKSAAWQGEESDEYVASAPEVEKLEMAMQRSGLGKGEGTIALGSLDSKVKKSRRSSAQAVAQQLSYKQQVVETGAVVQTGPGVPTWSWGRYPLRFSGPVKKDHQLKLYLLSPMINLLLSIARVLLIIFVGFIIFKRSLESNAHRRPDKPASGGSGVALTLGVILSGLALWPAEVAAEDTPSQSQLSELRDRLTVRPNCHPNCLATESIRIDVSEGVVELRAVVHAGDDVGWPLPGPALNWTPDRVSTDGDESRALVLRENGFVYLRIERGIHVISAKSAMPASGVLTFEFESKPRGVEIVAPGWDVEGLSATGEIDETVRLSKRAKLGTEEVTVRADEVHYPPWFTMHRSFSFGVEWQVLTRMVRQTPPGSQAFLRMPLLPGERVNSPDVQVVEGTVHVTFGRDDEVIEWVSNLEPSNWVKLEATVMQPWSVVWELRCSSIWPCEPAGIAPLDIVDDGMFVYRYRPYPGEQLEIALSKPAGVEGQSVTIERSKLTVRPGVRLAGYKLELEVVTSNGGVQTVGLPEGAHVEWVRSGGEEKAFGREGSRLEIPLEPGKQTLNLSWQQDGGIREMFVIPQIDLGRPGVDAVQEIELDADRWIILTGGPDWGPAVLFWGFFIAIILAALLLGRVRNTPLNSLQWAVLAVGLTQVPVPASLIIVGWFLLLSWRSQKRFSEGRGSHNFMQVILVMFTVVAGGCLLTAVYNGLAVQPDMQVMGGYDGYLSWYSDRVGNTLPSPWILSVPLGVWKLIMLAWALWLAASLVKWGPWAYRSFCHEGAWMKRPPKKKATS